jgi:hypothetical protein
MKWFNWLFKKKRNKRKEREEFLKSILEMQDADGNYLVQNENKILGYLSEEKAEVLKDKTGEAKWYI